MRTLSVLAAAFAAVVTAGCVSQQTAPAAEPAPATVQPGPSARQSALDLVPTGGLPAQALPGGDCGLFLWSRTDLTRFIFFSRAATGQARFLLGEEEVALTQVSAGGDIFGQFFTEQGFRAEGRPEAIELSVRPGDQLQGGQRISAGRIVITNAEGWRTIVPVLGVRACTPRTAADAQR